MNRKISLEKLEIVDESKVPKRTVETPWETVFSRIQRGKALVLTREQAPESTVRSALKRLQRRGKFRNLYMTTRKTAKGTHIYVVNPTNVLE